MKVKQLIAIRLAMRLMIIQLCILLLVFTSYAKDARGQEVLNKTITLSVENTKLKEVIKQIQTSANVNFVFSSKVIDVNKRVSFSVTQKKLGELLDDVFKPLHIYYKVIDDAIVLYNKAAEDDKDPAAINIHGTITDPNGTPLLGATVQVKGTNTKTLTDEKGFFTLNNVDQNAVLVVSYVGFATTEYAINNKTELVIALQQQENGLDQVVVIGYGTRQRKDLTGAVSTVNAKEITKSTSLTPELALQGQVAGVTVISGGGNPTARPTVRIRGVSTFGNPDPLYVIDGIPIEEGGAGATPDAVNDPTRRTPINLYTIINPNDIESITVLKDASATAAYGLRGGNGVILITTKQGKKGRVRVDFDGTYGTQKIPDTYSFLNTPQYVKFITEAYNANPELSGTTPLPIGEAIKFGAVWDPASPDYLGNSATYDWQDAIINHDAKIQNYNVRVSGASDNTSYNFSAGYANNDGPFLGVNAERYSISTNVKSAIGKYIETGLNLRLIQEKTIDAGYGGVTGDLNVYKAAPWQAIYDPNNPYGYAALWKLDDPITPSTFNISPVWQSGQDAFVPITNYLGTLATNSNPFTHQTFFGNAYVQIQPVAGLRIKGTISGEQLTISNKQFTSFDSWQFNETPGNPYGSVKNPTPGVRYNYVGFGNSVTTNIIKSINADYAHSFGQHNVNLTLNASQEEWKWTTQGGNTYITSDNPDLRDFHPSGSENSFDEVHGHYALIGYFGRLSYNYASRYYFDILARRDGSSRFAPGRQWGTFPAGSLAWRISQEEFMKGISFLNDLKIRGSYGVLGNEQTTGGWKYLSVSSATPPSYNTGNPNTVSPGVAFGNFANAELTWEKIRSANVGFDALLFNSKLSLTVDYYHKVTRGIIQSVTLTPSAGFEQSADINIADVLNRGFEFQAAYNRNFGEVNVSVSANFTTIHNEVLELNNHSALRGNNFSLEEGYPIGYLYGYKVGGIFQDQKQIDDWNASHQDNLSTEQKPGDIYFQDLYGAPTGGSTAKNPNKDIVVE